MTTYEYYREQGKSEEWIEANISGLCGDVEMVRAPKYDDGSDAYECGGYILHASHSAVDVIESRDEDGELLESWFLDNEAK